MLFQLLIIFFIAVIQYDAFPFKQRNYNTSSSNIRPEVYYINLDVSVQRRAYIEKQLQQLGLSFHRVRGHPWKELYIPSDLTIYNLWQTAWCSLNSTEVIPPKYIVKQNASSPLFNYSSIVSGLCGRGPSKNGHKNTLKELGCTASHILAMQKAIYSQSARSKYALVIEDDVEFLFDIDFEAMASTAPKDFGILQLFNSNKVTMLHTWKKFVANNASLWYKSEYLKYWSTCAYLINREVMKPIIDAMVYEQDDWQHFKIIAGIGGPCAPKECCIDGNDTRWGYWGKNVKFLAKSPCILSEKGLQADVFLYATTQTYMLSVPLIANGKGGGESTFHQDHVELLHRAAFRQQRHFINEMLTGRVEPPSFARVIPSIRLLNETEL